MNPRNRNRIGLTLILLLFAAPLLTAYVLNTLGWRPAGTRNYGTLIEPPQDLTAARFIQEDGKPIAWKDADWSWTVFALPGPACAKACLARIDELRRARLTLNQNAFRVRVVVLGDIDADALAAMKPVARARDADDKLAALRPAEADEVAVAFADPHGFLVLRYAVGYDANKLRKDLARLVKG
jgi:cytochrome oxidase Cu insertion factor (SCO1/SenC/PrrC family)